MSVRILVTFLAAAVATAACTVSPGSPSATTRPSVPAHSATQSPSPTATPSASPTVEPTPTPSPTTPEGLEAIDLRVTGCPGGVVLEWSLALDARFHHYTALRGPEPEIDPAWPPIAPAVDWGDTFVTDRFITSAVDASIIPTETSWNYRVMAYDVANRPVAASPVRHARLNDVIDLGPINIEPGDEPGTTLLDWRLFGGLSRCFSAYRVLIGPAGGTPSTELTSIARQDGSELVTTGLHSGETYTVRVDALRTTTLGGFIVARSETATYTVP